MDFYEKNGSSSNESTESKRRRHATIEKSNDDDLIEMSGRSKKRLAKKQDKQSSIDQVYSTHIDQCDDIDFDDNLFDIAVSEAVQATGGRVLPSWSTHVN